MEKLARDLTHQGALVPNDEVVIAGYGLQARDSVFAPGASTLKFARFKTFGFNPHQIQYTSIYAQTCHGRS